MQQLTVRFFQGGLEGFMECPVYGTLERIREFYAWMGYVELPFGSTVPLSFEPV